MGGWAPGRALRAFVQFACRYWTLVFPCAHCEVVFVERATRAIPDPLIRRIALDTLAEEHGNLEGAASFAAFLPRRARGHAIRSLVAFQAIFDFADSLAEQPVSDPLANGRALHEALLVAVTPGRVQPDYYAHYPGGSDGGYLVGLVEHCREAFMALPSHMVVVEPLARSVGRMIEYQALIHVDGVGDRKALAAWASEATPAGSGLRWWETAAGGASSLVAFALIAAAARPSLSAREAAAIEAAYFPWVGALHVLLDSLVDLPLDEREGHHSIVEHYASPAQRAERMNEIAAVAVRSTRALPDGEQHLLLLAGMIGFYLAAPTAQLPHAAEATERITATLGQLARPVLAVHCVRRWAKRAGGSP